MRRLLQSLLVLILIVGLSVPAFSYYNEAIEAPGNLKIVFGSKGTMILKGDGTLWLFGNGHASPVKVMDNLLPKTGSK